MTPLLHTLSYLLFARFIVQFALGLNIRHHSRVPSKGPAIFVVQHRSHWDSLILASLLPDKERPALNSFSTRDYFHKKPLVAWFYQNIMGIHHLSPSDKIPDQIPDKNASPLQPCHEALSREQIVFLFNDKQEDDAEQNSAFSDNLYALTKDFPETPIIPIDLRGLGNELPKDRTLFTSYFCDVFIGQAVYRSDLQQEFRQQLHKSQEILQKESYIAGWK